MPVCNPRSWPLVPMLLVLVWSAAAQSDRYIVHFKDKSGTNFSSSKPEQFLSAKAIARRTKNNVAVTAEDFPVNPSYRQALTTAGAKVLFTSRWFNCALVEATTQTSSVLGQLSMVSAVEYVAPGATATGRGSRVNKHQEQMAGAASASQLAMLGIDLLHSDGYTGTGVTIAVMDSGFPGVSTLPAFDHLRAGGRIRDAFNFAYNRTDVDGFDTHGENVLSIMAAKAGSTFTGSAPDANYLLYVTEYVPSEYRVEEYNWLFAAERADSAGADVINTSLGYFTFDDPSMDYTYGSMDGKTTLISRAASMASDRGIIVVCSAGNEGAGSWKYISAPADAKDVLAVGAVDPQGAKALFSSVGPTADGRTKPDIMAQGAPAQFINSSGISAGGSGTSFSSPIAAGLVAGLIQALPEYTSNELIAKVRQAGDRAQSPDNQYGFGIPGYIFFKKLITGMPGAEQVRIYPNPGSGDQLKFSLPDGAAIDPVVTIIDPTGKQLLSGNAFQVDHQPGTFTFDTFGLPAGWYIVRIGFDGAQHRLRWVVR